MVMVWGCVQMYLLVDCSRSACSCTHIFTLALL
uniref:Uncharacterized protein n=1 Tax=Rhizophora mucronata TaxID=61149 RepID=A0A2P2P8M3_RHIMU